MCLEQKVIDDYQSGLPMMEIIKVYHISTRRFKQILSDKGVAVRSKSESQKLSLSSGRRPHPTQGKKHSMITKEKISQSVVDKWDSKTPEQKQLVANKTKQFWETAPASHKNKVAEATNAAIRLTSKEGSKLEKFLTEALTKAGYVVEYHKDSLVANQKLQIDLLLPQQNIAIEVDGPSHYLPIWGPESLEHNQRADADKNGLLLGNGFCVLRVKNLHKNTTANIMRKAASLVIAEVGKIEKKFPDLSARLIYIEL